MEDTAGMKSVDFSLSVQHPEQNSGVEGAFALPKPLPGVASVSPGSTLSSLTSQPSTTTSSSSALFVDRLQPLASHSPVCTGDSSLGANGRTISQSEARGSEIAAIPLAQISTLSQSTSQQHHPHLQHAPLPSFLQHGLTVPAPGGHLPSQATLSTTSATGTSSVAAALGPRQNLPSTQPSFNFNPSHTASATPSIPGLPPFQMSLPPSLGAGLPAQMAQTGALPLIPTVYPYHPYPSIPSLPSQPISSSIVRVSAPAGFPAQTLVSGYPSYIPPTVYDTTPVSTGNYT